jgi:hypothetical protein
LEIVIKFKPDSDFKANAADSLNNLIGEPVFDKVEQLFPGEPDIDLASIYIGKISDDQRAEELVDWLNQKSEIDYAHVAQERRNQI